MSLESLNQRIVSCEKCPRLRQHCVRVAKEKRRQFQNEAYWGRPVPGFGDENARVLIVGLAPAAHGANRTGRMFTGDNSGLWLYRALHRAGFANQERSENRADGLRLRDAYITAVARCAPPENKPTPVEIASCSPFLKAEIEMLRKVKVYVVLGQIALKGLWGVLPDSVKPSKGVPRFTHGARVPLKDGRLLICSYHPSQQNTFTKKLTEPMFDGVFSAVSAFLGVG
ncbi:MAG: uracil-DNA glycosylase [Proteobacteria bacterium]|nr:uracil-DNA glycosylase [Pseudomonadota bacterium]